MSVFFRRPSDPHAVAPPFPTYLLPIRPFRARSRHASSDSTSSTESADSTFSAKSAGSSHSWVSSTNTLGADQSSALKPTIGALHASPTSSDSSPRSTTVTISAPSASPFCSEATPAPPRLSVPASADKILAGHQSYISCARCATDLCLSSQIISKGFTGRHGRAYLVDSTEANSSSISGKRTISTATTTLPNTYLAKPVTRALVTGQHTVADLTCLICGSNLGWKYIAAHETAQKYKIGKFILETKRVRVSVRWEDGEHTQAESAVSSSTSGACNAANTPSLNYDSDESSQFHMRKSGRDQIVEFDSQDEDECEDLFAGVWSPGLAIRRRQRKSERYRRRADQDQIPKVKSGPASARSSLDSLR